MLTYILASTNPIGHVAAHKLFTITIGSYEIAFNNHMLMMVIAVLLLVVFLPYIARGHHMVPRGAYNAIESVCCYLREEMAYPLLHEKTDRYIKYLWSLFFFILTCNVMGMIPLDSIIYMLSGFNLKHIGGTATANIWVTGAMASLSFFMIHINGIKDQGPWHYIKNFIPKVPLVMVPMFYVLEIVGAFVKPFSLAIRLFANMLAGHTMLAVLTMLAMMSHSYIVGGVTLVSCTALAMLELFVAFLQA
ncbi:MAG: F0F1 ATP synthase subunit A, partial [Sedimentisphaerales bacterium]|nr:F0F1 ATP synthase subunit A [Sedimentisphaerales bacterium]